MDVRSELEALGFVPAGAIRPIDSGKRSKAELVALGLTGSVVYALVVGDQFKKCGDTGRKAATLKTRMRGCAYTINKIISGDLVGPFTENFKRLAPLAIKEGQTIHVWAREASSSDCRRLQRELNHKYDTIRTGWANRLE